jgi:O-acetyl-ADP-ribose deacetylase (regulator of RNase III)
MTLVSIIKGNIESQHVDAIVNSANRWVAHGGGVTGAIYRAAGAEYHEACAKLGGCKTGEAKITPGFALPAKYIIHTVGVEYLFETGDKEGLHRSCYTNSLKLAKEHGMRTIAFPSISTGAFQYPLAEATRIGMKAVMEFIAEYPDAFDEIRFVAFHEDTHEVLLKIWVNVQS